MLVFLNVMHFKEFGCEKSNLAEFYFQAGCEHWISSGIADFFQLVPSPPRQQNKAKTYKDNWP